MNMYLSRFAYAHYFLAFLVLDSHFPRYGLPVICSLLFPVISLIPIIVIRWDCVDRGYGQFPLYPVSSVTSIDTCSVFINMHIYTERSDGQSDDTLFAHHCTRCIGGLCVCILVLVNGIAWIYPLDISIHVITSHLHSLPVTVIISVSYCYYLLSLVLTLFLLILHHSFISACRQAYEHHSLDCILTTLGLLVQVSEPTSNVAFWWSFGLDLGACGTFGGR